MDLRIVGVATFPPVNQSGSDMPRLGIGALVNRDAFLRLQGSADNQPEFTAVRLVAGADPAAVIARNPDGFTDATRSHTRWFTDTKPAELRQLDAAMPYLRGAIVVRLPDALRGARARAVDAGAEQPPRPGDPPARWARPGASSTPSRCGRSCRSRIATLAVGLPVGIAIGRWVFTQFAHSLAVVDGATTSPANLALLAAATVAAIALATLMSVVLARRTRGRGAIDLRRE